MSLAAITIWANNQILTAAALNAEFANIRNNALSLISPLTGNLDAGAFRITNISAGSTASPSIQIGSANNGIFASTATTFNIASSGNSVFAIQSTGNQTVSQIIQTGSSIGPYLDLVQLNVATQQGTLRFVGYNSAAAQEETATIFAHYLDSADGNITSQLDFSVRNADATVTAALSTLGAWTDASLAASKKYIGDVSDVTAKMSRLKTLGVYIGKNTPDEKRETAERHFSPTAEDFYEVFGLGTKPTEEQGGIAAKDVAWLAVRMCQELEARLDGR